MGKLTLHTGPAGPYYFFQDKIRDHILNDQTAYLYLLPVNRAVRYLKKSLARDIAPKTLADPKIFTFDGLFRYLYQRMPDRRIVAGKATRLILLDHLMQEHQGDLEYFRSGRGRFITKIDRMLAELLEFGIRDQAKIQPPDSCAYKFKDFQRIIALLFERYGGTMIDEYALPDVVKQNLDKAILQKHFGPGLRIYISGYGIYTPPMIGFLEAVKSWSDIEIKLDYVDENQDLFFHTRDAFEMLRRIADQEVKYKDGDPAGAGLFGPAKKPVQKSSAPVRFRRLKGKTPQDEVIQIAAKVRKWHRENIPLHEIGITFPNTESYAPLIRRIFARFQIPFNLSTGFALAQSPLILTFLQVFEVIRSGYRTAEFHKLLISPFCTLCTGTDGHLFQQLTAMLQVRHLTGSWKTRLLSVAAEDLSGSKVEESELRDQLNKIDDILKILKKLESPAPAENIYRMYFDVLNELGMLKWYEQDLHVLNRVQREKEFRAFNRFIKIAEQVNWLLNHLYGEDRIHPDDFYRHLKTVVQDATYSLKEWSDYGVQIMPRLEILSLNTRRLIVGGLIEGDFPRRYTRDIFFNDAERQQIGLNAAEDLVSQDRFLFYQLMMSQAEEIVLSYPEFEGEAALLPSTFIENLAVHFEVREDLPDPDRHHYLTADNFTETLSTRLNEMIREQDREDLLAWKDLYGEDRVRFWLNGADHHIRKQFRDQTSDYEGNLTDSRKIRSILATEFHTRNLSVSALESYAFCPMQYFLQRILRLEEDEPSEEYLSAREKGSLIHRILFRFYTHLREINAQKQPWQLRDRLFGIAREEMEQLPYEGLLWKIETENLLGTDQQPGLLDRFLEEEQAFLSQHPFTPRFFELAFGPAARHPDADPASRPEPVRFERGQRILSLTGKIDRIDTDETGRAVITDYKLSANTKGRQLPDMINGLSLQLPVYALAVQQVLAGVRPLAAVYYQVKDANNCGRVYLFADAGEKHNLPVGKKNNLPPQTDPGSGLVTFQELLAQAEDHLFQLVEKLVSGDFTHTHLPDDDRCKSYCMFHRICRKDVGKLMQMPSESDS